MSSLLTSSAATTVATRFATNNHHSTGTRRAARPPRKGCCAQLPALAFTTPRRLSHGAREAGRGGGESGADRFDEGQRRFLREFHGDAGGGALRRVEEVD